MSSLPNGLKLDKSIPVPLYYQLKMQLLDLIDSGKLTQGALLPAENSFCEALHISRPTVRQALTELAEEGYLVRHKGRGSFITKPKVKDRFLSQLQSFNDEIRSKGMTPSTRVLIFAKAAGIPEINSHLELDLKEPLFHLSRLRFADGIPLVYLDTYMPYRNFECIADCDFTVESLYAQMESLCKIRVAFAKREIEAVPARKREADLLDIEVGKPICLVRSVAYTSNMTKPVEYSIARYRGDRTKFFVDTYREP